MTVREKRHRHGWGLFTLLRFGLVLIALLLLNSVLVKAMIDSFPAIAEDLRVTQTLQFALPVVLIYLEYWLMDVIRAAGSSGR